MKVRKKMMIMVCLCTVCWVCVPAVQVQAAIPIVKIIKEAIKKVIKAVDLMIQRLQNKTIALQNAQKVLENELSKLKLDQIADWTERQRQLYQQYYEELWQVRNAIATYKRIQEIIQAQAQLVDDYTTAWALVRQDEHFTADEIAYMGQVYTGMLEESVYHLDQLVLVVNAFKTQMSDADRLSLISRAAEGITQCHTDLKQFNAQHVLLSLQRAKDAQDLTMVKKLYGLP